jgi:hypothetical protein
MEIQNKLKIKKKHKNLKKKTSYKEDLCNINYLVKINDEVLTIYKR